MTWHPRNRGNQEQCTHFVLARDAVAQVGYCTACGVFHLAIDSLSIRFRPTALRDLRDTLAAALGAYEQAQRIADENGPPAPHDGMH